GRARIGHRMQVEQEIGGVVAGPQRARAVELPRAPWAVEHAAVPHAVEVLVEAARSVRIGRVERFVCGGVGENKRQRTADGPHLPAQQPVEDDGAAHFVAVRHTLDRDVRSARRPVEAPYVGNSRVPARPARYVGNGDIDAWAGLIHAARAPVTLLRRALPNMPRSIVQARHRCCASRCMNASQRPSCSRLTHSFGWWACPMCPGPQITAGIDAPWNSAASVPNETLCWRSERVHAWPMSTIGLWRSLSNPGISDSTSNSMY